MISRVPAKLAIAASLAVMTTLPLTHSAADAAAPLARTQAPGFYRMMLGDFEVTALSDGTVPLPVDQLLIGPTPTEIGSLLGRSYLTSPVETSVNVYLINTGKDLVLVDGGAGALYGPTLGKLMTSLRAAGYQPEQIDHVLLTHLHADHVGGLMSGKERAFPNATVHVDGHDAKYWLSTEQMARATPNDKAFFQGAMASLNPYAAAGKLRTFDGPGQIVPGIAAVSAYGHTPGHSLFAVESKGEKLVLWGDLMHVAAVQFPKPSVTIRFDVDPSNAAAQRAKLYAEAAKGGYWVAGAHLSFPGIGHIRTNGGGYDWIPANYRAEQ